MKDRGPGIDVRLGNEDSLALTGASGASLFVGAVTVTRNSRVLGSPYMAHHQLGHIFK